LADHETDQPAETAAAGTEPAEPATGQHSGGTFRWPSGSLPGLFGQQPDAQDTEVAAAPPGPAGRLPSPGWP